MPADRIQKSLSPKDVPDLGDPDRKRMLNVLAQRRYRKFQMSTSLKLKLTSCAGQRRREKIAALEAQSKRLEGLAEQRSNGSSPQTSAISATPKSPDAIHEPSVIQGDVEELVNVPYEDDLLGFAVHEDPFNIALMQDFSGTY
jgi:hypothetical protein